MGVIFSSFVCLPVFAADSAPHCLDLDKDVEADVYQHLESIPEKCYLSVLRVSDSPENSVFIEKIVLVLKIGIAEQIPRFIQSGQFAIGQYRDESNEWKRRKAYSLTVERMDRFFSGVSNTDAKYIALYAPDFTNIILSQGLRKKLVAMNPQMHGVLKKLLEEKNILAHQ